MVLRLWLLPLLNSCPALHHAAGVYSSQPTFPASPCHLRKQGQSLRVCGPLRRGLPIRHPFLHIRPGLPLMAWSPGPCPCPEVDAPRSPSSYSRSRFQVHHGCVCVCACMCLCVYECIRACVSTCAHTPSWEGQLRQNKADPLRKKRQGPWNDHLFFTRLHPPRREPRLEGALSPLLRHSADTDKHKNNSACALRLRVARG